MSSLRKVFKLPTADTWNQVADLTCNILLTCITVDILLTILSLISSSIILNFAADSFFLKCFNKKDKFLWVLHASCSIMHDCQTYLFYYLNNYSLWFVFSWEMQIFTEKMLSLYCFVLLWDKISKELKFNEFRLIFLFKLVFSFKEDSFLKILM